MPLPRQQRKKVGEMLIAGGLINEAQLDRALAEQRQHGGRIGTILRSMGIVTEEDITKVLGDQMGIQSVVLSSIIIDPDVVQIIPETLARRHQAIPLYIRNNMLSVAMADPLNVFAQDDIRRVSRMEIEPVVCTETEIMKAIDRFYSGTATMEEAAQQANDQGYGTIPDEQVIDLERIADETPIIKLVNTMIGQAVREGASDIHVEPDADVLRIRYRIDGVLKEVMTPAKHLQTGIISRIKIMADLDISEKRIPQDGRIPMKVGDKDFDIRVSTLPTIFGEKAVMRLLNKTSVLLGLEDLGMSAAMLAAFKKIIARPYGLILVTGPTGSGKTTTLYAALNTLNSMEKNIVTIEDPVEYQLKVVNQVNVNPKAGVTFATGLRSVLRQDPDIMMVGEIRDLETAAISIQAALTGHLIFTTLHTNDSIGAVARMVDMGVEPFLISSSLIAVAGQRLVRKVCTRCRESYRPSSEVLASLELPVDKHYTFMKGAGCQDCRQTGYSGRTGIYEILLMNESIRNLIVSRALAREIRDQATKSGWIPLRRQGLAVALKGITTPEEILRVTQETEA